MKKLNIKVVPPTFNNLSETILNMILAEGDKETIEDRRRAHRLLLAAYPSVLEKFLSSLKATHVGGHYRIYQVNPDLVTDAGLVYEVVAEPLGHADYISAVEAMVKDFLHLCEVQDLIDEYELEIRWSRQLEKGTWRHKLRGWLARLKQW